MQSFRLKAIALAVGAATVFGGGIPNFAFAQEEQAELEEIITIGSRRKARSSADTIAPVDVISANDIADQAGVDISDLIRTVVPSYQVNTQPISDAGTIVRPANLRGLSPDNTLVLLNGKRRHRAAVISFLGGGISDGAHGPDIGVFPAIGLKQVEVLRDGASSQYGADAIAGVINFTLRDNREGGTIEAKWGSTYEGDGDNFRIGANLGFPLGKDGFINVTGELAEADGTFRSVQRDDAAALIAAGNTAVGSRDVNTITDDVVQYWGQPDVDDDYKFFVNAALPISESVEAYAFGNYAERSVDGGFFFRNPTNRGGVYAGPQVDPITGAAVSSGGVNSISVGDLSGNTRGDCPAGIPLTGANGLIPNQQIQQQVIADPNCFSFVELFPGGFTPRFGGDVEDVSFVLGLRGEFNNGLRYDVSYTYGQNEAQFRISNTVNASLGPNTPTEFSPGAYTQTDNNFNIDLSYGLDIGLASDLNIAGGFEYRDEEFEIEAGDPGSFALGPLAAPSSAFPNGQGFASSSNGFGGFTPASAGSNSQDNFAFYLDLETDITDALTVQAAIRYEDFSTFGDTTNYKVGALYRFTDSTVLRSTYSTGFHAPTTGQANVTNITTQFVGSSLVDTGTLPLNSNAGQFVNEQLGNPFSLNPEDADNFSVGFGTELGPLSVTVDYFYITVDNRIAITDAQDFIGLLRTVANNNNVALPANAQTSQIINALGGAGIVNPADFAGAEDLTEFGFFANDFDTRTQGIDLVASMPFDLGSGATTLALAFNWTDTTVTRRGSLSDTRLRQLEENLPNIKGNLSLRHSEEKWRALARMNFHDNYFEAHLDSGDLALTPGGEVTFDVEFGYNVTDGLELIAGVANLFDSLPDENEFSGIAGARFPATAPFGFSGGQYYFRAKYDF